MHDSFHLMTSRMHFCSSDHLSRGRSPSRKIRIDINDFYICRFLHSKHNDRGYLLYYTHEYNNNVLLYFIY